MKLHDEIEICNATIIRVPGGWIYKTYQDSKVNGSLVYNISAVFIPYSTELIEEGFNDNKP